MLQSYLLLSDPGPWEEDALRADLTIFNPCGENNNGAPWVCHHLKPLGTGHKRLDLK